MSWQAMRSWQCTPGSWSEWIHFSTQTAATCTSARVGLQIVPHKDDVAIRAIAPGMPAATAGHLGACSET